MLTAFRQYLSTLKLSPVSRKLYLADIRQFLASLDTHPTIDLVSSPKTYTRYLESLRAQAMAPAMIKRKTASLRQFGSFIAKGYGVSNPVIGSELLRVRNLSPNLSDKYIKHFINYLKSIHLSPLTIKSYKSDITLYLDWAKRHSLVTQLTQLLTPQNIQIYLDYLTDYKHSPSATIERKSQSLTRFRDWYHSSYPTPLVANNSQTQSLQSRRPHEDSSTSTSPETTPQSVKISNSRTRFSFAWPKLGSELLGVRNLLSLTVLLLFAATLAIFGYRQFSRDVRLTQAFPSTPVTPNRQISFQGRLENAGGTPITSATNLLFKLWDADTSGTQLYTSGTCSITPDQDGVFSTQIGGTCGSAIASSVFTENQNVWLEVTVASETLSPRQQIATVAYALNSETIQGFPISATVSAIRNTVVPMNQWGEIIVGEQSPRLTGVSGTFQISAPALSLVTNTGTNGNITLAPDGTGQVNVNGNTTSTNFFNVANAQLTTGSLITGTVGNNNSGFKLLDLLSGSSPTSKFSVDAAGNAILTGDLTLSGGNLNSGNIPLTLGDATTDSITLLTDGTGNGEIVLPADSISPDEVLSSGQVDGYCLKYVSSGDTWAWGTCGSGGGGTTYWRLTNGAISPVNDTLDLLVGADATSSAKAGFININQGTPTATVSAGVAGAASLTATGILGTTAYQSLTLGNATTGNIVLKPGGTTALTAIGNDVTLADDLNLTSAADLIFGGATSLGETTAAGDSGAFLVGTFDEFDYSNGANVQAVLNDLDIQLGALTLGTAGPWTDAGTYMYPTNGEVLGNSAAAGSNKIAGLYLADSAPLTFGTDNDFIFSFNNSASTLGSTLLAGTRLGIGTTNALATFDVRSSLGTIPVASISGNTAMATLVVDQSGIGDIFTASSSGEPRFVVKSNGNVGIGVSNPTTKLQIGGTSPLISNSSGDITIDSFGGQLLLADADTINIGGLTNVTYNSLANAGEAPEEAAISSDNDLYIGGDLEIDGSTYLGPATFGNVVYFAGGTTYYVDASGNAKFNDIIAADTGNPGLTVGNGTTGFLKIGGSTISDNSGDLTLDSDSAAITLASDDTTLTASGLASFTTAAALAMNSTTGLTLGDNSTIYGGDNASGTLTLSSTSNATKGNLQFFSSSNTLSPTGNLTLAGDLTINGGELYLTPLTSSASTTEGTVYYDSDVDKLYVYANGAYQRIATNLTSWSANNSSVASGSYVQIAHNSGSNDLSAMGWFLDTVSGLYKNISEYSHNLVHNLQNQWSDSAYTSFNIDTSGTLRDSLMAYWNMDEPSTGSVAVTRNDSYSTNHLTDNNTTASSTGKISNGADFEGGNIEYLEVSDNDNLSTGDIDFTVSAWVKLESESSGTTNETIIGKYDSSSVREYSLHYTGLTTDRFGFNLYDSGGVSRCTVTDTTAVTTGTWYYVVGWHDKTANTCNIQVNNNTASSAGETGVPSDTVAKVRIGARETGASVFDGVIDEVGFWKKVLTSTERNDLYNSGSGNTYGPHTGFVRTQANATDVSVTPAIDVGTGGDGAISVTSDTNINTTSLISGRSCADGGDAVNYSVSSLTSTSATLESTPSSGCLAVGDEILLINLRGDATLQTNLGNYETLRIAGVAGTVVTFTTSKTQYYGDNATDDTGIGLATTDQVVMLQRVPNYTNVTLSNAGTDLTASAWSIPTGSANNGAGEGGVMFFRASGTVTVASSTTINTNALGYTGAAASGAGGNGGTSFCGLGGTGGSPGTSGAGGGGGNENNNAGGAGTCGGGGGGAASTGTGGTGSASLGGAGGGGGMRAGGGGAGYGTGGTGGPQYTGTAGGNGGTNSSGNGGNNGGGGGGGGTYGIADLSKMMYGSGGGGGGFGSLGAAGSGGTGGGILYISANTITVSGGIQSNGGAGGNATSNSGSGGGGAGGSLRLEGSTLNLGTSLTTASAGAAGTGGQSNGGAGGSGRIAIYYASSISGTTSPAATSTFSGYHTYGVYHSPVISTPNAATLESLRWEYPGGVPSGLKKVEFQTRTGASANPTDGTWETWKTSATSSNCASPNCVSLSNGNTHTEWTGTNVTVADGDVTRNVDMFEDEDESTAGNITKGTSSTNGGTAEDTISSTDFSNYDYVTFWVRASQSGSSLKFGFGESAGTEQEETIKIDAADTWQKVYWDLSDIPTAARNAVTKLRFTNLVAVSNVFYIDNVQLERHLTTSSGSAITSTPNSYFQYRIIFTTTNTAYYPSVENIQLLYTDGFKIVQTDTNTVRLYNYTGSNQNLRLEAVTFGADLAEWYTVNDESIGPGDLVALTGTVDDYGVPILRKTNTTSDPQLIGAISTKAGQTLGLEAPNRRLLALVGRIPVRLDESSPPLAAGDALTSSTTPGLARKAKAGELTFARSTVAWNPGDAPGVLAIVNNTVPTSGIQLVDAVIRKVDGVWQTVETGTETVVETVAGFAKVVATKAELADLSVDLISPLATGSAITIAGPVVIRPLQGSVPCNDCDPVPALVVDGEIDAATLSARTAVLQDIQAQNITAKNIIADSITAGAIIGLDAKIATLSASTTAQLTDAELTTITDRIKDRIASITSPATAADIPTPDEPSLIPDSSDLIPAVASSSAQLASADIDFATINQYLAVVGTASIATLNVTDGLFTESISSPTGLLALGQDTLLIDSAGLVAINGDLTVTGSLALRPGSELPDSSEPSELKKLLSIYNEAGVAVATIDASGSANLASLTTQLITIASGAIASASATPLETNVSSNATAGNSILVAPNTELVIESPFVTGDTLVYLTPTGYTENKVLFVKAKETGRFTVAIDAPASADIPFNWWIIGVKP